MKTDRIKNGNYLTKFFTQFPNIIDDSDLSPFEFRVLIHYYRVGECWEGVRTTAEKCRMSTGKVTDVRKTLEEKGFIKVTPNGDGVTIEVVDKTKENLEKYCSPHEQGVHHMNSSVHHMNDTRSPHEHKNNHIKNNQLRNITAYAVCVDFWLKEFHPDWTFSSTHGKTLKQLISKIKTLLVAKGRSADDTEIGNFFKHMCLSLPEFFKDKDLPTINSKFNEIIEQIKNSKNGNGTSKSESKYRN